MGLAAILTGWGKHLRLLEVTPTEQQRSEARMKECSTCEYAKESKALEFVNGSAEHIDTIYCSKCKCPCHQKSLVLSEECPLGKWANIK